jgi:hypothetical protein
MRIIAPELRRESQRLATEIAALPTIDRAVEAMLSLV